MRSFLIRTFYFLIPLFLIWFSAELVFRNIPSYWKNKNSAFELKKEQIEVLILGNSHAQNGINPNNLDYNSFNMAQGYQSIYFDLKIVEKHLDKMANLKYVLISVDYHSLFYTHYEPRDIYYHYYFDIDYRNKAFIKEDISWSLFGLDKSTITATRLLSWTKTLLNKESKKNKSFIWKGNEGSKLKSFSKLDLKRKIVHFDDIISSGLQPSVEQDLITLITILQKKNIEPILITLPVSNRLKEKFNPVVLAQNDFKIDSINNNLNLTYINFQEWDLPDRYFYDFDHLNNLGAAIATDSINHILKSLEVKESH